MFRHEDRDLFGDDRLVDEFGDIGKCLGISLASSIIVAETARACLQRLSGRRHRVLTAVCVVDASGKLREVLVTSTVRFARLTTEQIEAYVASGEWQGKAGGYGIQGPAGAFVAFLSGSFTNVVGLPLHETAKLLNAPRS